MNNSKLNEIEQTINQLLDSNVTAYEIESETNLNRSRVTRLRNGERKLDNTNWSTIKELYDYAVQNKI